MKYDDLSFEAKMVIMQIYIGVDLPSLVNLNKDEMGKAIAQLVNLIGQNGDEYVHFVYNTSVKILPEAILDPPLWLLTSFVMNSVRSNIRKFGYSDENEEGWRELAADIIELARHKSLKDYEDTDLQSNDL